MSDEKGEGEKRGKGRERTDGGEGGVKDEERNGRGCRSFLYRLSIRLQRSPLAMKMLGMTAGWPVGACRVYKGLEGNLAENKMK